MTKKPEKSKPISDTDALIVAEVVSEASVSGVPLPVGLRAAADEAPSRRLANSLYDVADSLESGQSLDDLLGRQHSRYGRYVRELLHTAVANGNGPLILLELRDQNQARRDLWRSVLGAVAYPAVLLGLSLLILVFIGVVVAAPMFELYEDFDLQLPYLTEMLIWAYAVGLWWLLGTSAFGILAAFLLRLFGGPTLWQRMVATVPLVGAMWHWSGVAEWARVLGVLLQQQIPLPSALRLAADGVHDGNLRSVSLMLAEDVEKGRPLAESIDATWRMPPTLAPVIQWGETAGRLDEALRMAGDMFEERVQMRAQLLKSVFPPVVFVCVAVFAAVVVVGLYAPMFSLINALA